MVKIWKIYGGAFVNKVGILLLPPGNVIEMFEKAKKAEGLEEEVSILLSRSEKEKQEILKESVALITSSISLDDLNVAKNLKLIQVPFAGVDTFNVKELMKRGIILANVHSNATAVAEYAFGLLISLAKDFIRSDRDLRRGYWHGWMGKEPNIEIEGKTVAIIGLGSIGRKVAEFAKAFGMYVVGVKKSLQNYPNVDEVYGTEDILKAVEKAHFVISALPLTDETEGLIDRNVFNAMKGKYFVNVGRGPVVNQEDLFVALKNHVLKGAAIDTWWNYPEKPLQFAQPSEYPFFALDNVVMTAHAAGFSEESVKRNWEDSVRNIVKLFMGKEVENIITERGY
jgi:phosphoglycerate dehydrogenase-like enzyme